MSWRTNYDILIVRPGPVRLLGVKVNLRIRLDNLPSAMYGVRISELTPSWSSL